MVSIQDEPIVLEPGAKTQRGFFGWFEADKPTATTDADVSLIDAALALPEAICPPWPATGSQPRPAARLVHHALRCWNRSISTSAEIQRIFRRRSPAMPSMPMAGCCRFSPATGSHVVLKAKELQVLRPHGHLLRSGGSLTPDESALTSTAWMTGVFHSMVTQGHVSINRFLSTCHTYLGLFRSHGQRVFVETRRRLAPARHAIGL